MKEDTVAGSIICGVDDSDSAKRAARVARALSSKLGLRLVFVCVVENGSSPEQISAVAERLERLHGGVTEVDCGADWFVEAGHPAERLLAAAAARNASLIVVGSTGRASISAEASRRAPCPVVVVPPEEGASAEPGEGAGGPQVAGGLVRFDLPVPTALADTDFAGGIVRFSLGHSE